MGVWLRRLRAALGNAVTWAVGWAPVGLGLGMYWGSGIPGVPFWRYAFGMALSTAFAGFIAGGSFALVLGVVERRRTLADLKVSRIALWGAAGGMAYPVVSFLVSGFGGINLGIGFFLAILGITGVLGAGCSAGSLLLARRAERLELQTGAPDELEAGSSP